MANNRKGTEFLGDLKPLSVLWEGAGAPFPSETSARWALRNMREQLAAAGALALHRRRMYVDVQKVGEFMRQAAVDRARKLYNKTPA